MIYRLSNGQSIKIEYNKTTIIKNIPYFDQMINMEKNTELGFRIYKALKNQIIVHNRLCSEGQS